MTRAFSFQFKVQSVWEDTSLINTIEHNWQFNNGINAIKMSLCAIKSDKLINMEQAIIKLLYREDRRRVVVFLHYDMQFFVEEIKLCFQVMVWKQKITFGTRSELLKNWKYHNLFVSIYLNWTQLFAIRRL